MASVTLVQVSMLRLAQNSFCTYTSQTIFIINTKVLMDNRYWTMDNGAPIFKLFQKFPKKQYLD